MQGGKQKGKHGLDGMDLGGMQEQLRQLQSQLGQVSQDGAGQIGRGQGPSGKSLFTDAAARKEELKRGVKRCQAGDGSKHIQGGAGSGEKQPEMDLFMNDLDIQDLSKVPGLIINGLECFMVSGQSEQPYITHA